MNIIEVTPKYPPDLGGVQMCAQEMANRLASRGNSVTVFTSNQGSKGKKNIIKKNLNVFYLKSIDVAHTPIYPGLIFKLLKIPKDSIVHVHLAAAFSSEIVAMICKLRKIPYVVQFHAELEQTGPLGFILPIYKKMILKKVLRSASKIIVLNDFYKKFIKERYGISKNIEILPPGVNESFFIKKQNKDRTIKNLLYVGRLSTEKRVDMLIDAISSIKNNVKLYIVGEGPEEKRLKDQVLRLNLSNVEVVGKKTGKELLKYFEMADIFLLASEYEGLPLVLLEAMASGIPIIASDVRGTHELVNNIGVLVKPVNSKNFAVQIDKLINNPEKINKIKIAEKREIEKYRWDSLIIRLENIYKEVLDEN